MPTESFDLHLAALAGQSAANARAAAAPGLAARVWQIPPAAPTDGSVDVQNPEFWAAALDRDDLNRAYLDAHAASPAVRGRAMACKAAIDYVGAYERAAQARHASPVRCRVWASARRYGHGDVDRGIYGAIRRQLAAWYGAVPAAGPA